MLRTGLLVSTAVGLLWGGAAAAQTTTPNSNEWSLIKLTPDIVADAYNNANPKVYVGVYDGLTDCRHPEFGGECLNFKFDGGRYRFYNDHGTHVAGTVAGATHGVAHGAYIYNYAVFDDRRYIAGGTKLIEAWRHAAAGGASIASMSFGCKGTALCFSADEVRAMGNADLSSTIFVKAAGNDGVDLANESISVTSTEAKNALARLILVGSVNASGVVSSFSNKAGEGCLLYSGASTCSADTQWKYRFLSAPGESIYAALPGGKYGYMSGTSMATPIVSGVIALMHAKWPTLKANPAGTADILFKTATDVGTPGLDNVYGWGLLNVAQAWQAQGDTTVTSASNGSTTISSTSLTTGTATKGLEQALSGVTAWDAYGRDYRVDQVSSFDMRRTVLSQLLGTGGRSANLGGHAAWTSAFFAPPETTRRAWTGFGPQGAVLNNGFGFDRSMRAGLDVPVNGGALGLRLTGESSTRADFAADPALAPLSFFASSDLLNRSALVSFSKASSETTRLVAFGALSGGAKLEPDFSQPFDDRTGFNEARREHGLSVERSPREQAAFGLGFWKKTDDQTVLGVTASVVAQRHGFYDLASTLDTFDAPTHLLNVGAAGSRTYGRWDLFGSVEATVVDAPETGGPIRFSDTVLASGEAGVRRANLLFGGKGTSDALSLSLALSPSAIAGALQLDYLERTADGLGRQAVNREVGLAEITGRTFRVQSAYTIKRQGLSFGLATGADLADEAGVSVASQLHWAF